MAVAVASVVRWQARTAHSIFVLACFSSGCTAARAPHDRSTDASIGGASAVECGDGHISDSERCDIAIAAGQAGACPIECTPGEDPCAPVRLHGSGCEARCESAPIAARLAGDACCPNGATEADDPDCVQRCGNGVLDLGETCDPPSRCPLCPASSACLTVVATGSADACTKVCTSAERTACRSDDGCCPRGCTSMNDRDCSSRCGDGVVDQNAGETCEASGETTCPESCDDGDPCTEDVRVGSVENCNLACEHVELTMPVAGDSCCPEGANATVDPDCKPTCGNRVLEAEEACDDGNTDAGDGCDGGCAFESREQSCAAIELSDDACGSCVCRECFAAESCFVPEDPEETAACLAIAACMRANGCSDLECYCGRNVPACLNGNPAGPCRESIESGVGSSDARWLTVQLMNPNSTAGRALRRLRCERVQCRNFCQP